MPKNPKVSVILPAYNAEEYLHYAVDSILDQTYKNFELLLINDGSKDNTKKIIDEYAQKDNRVVPVHQENMGLVATLNKGISLAKGQYIARMDADDISLPRRFETQVDLLEKNSKAVLCASSFDAINEYNEFVKLNTAPGFDEDLKRSMRLYNPIAHGSVMFAKQAVVDAGGYSDQVGPAEDYELWIRLSKLGQFVYSERSLFRWRMNPEGITHSKNDVMQESTKKLARKLRNEHPVEPYSVKKMVHQGRKYINVFGSAGVIMKEIVLEDNYNLGIKAIKEGHVIRGLRFILSVALTGRTGLGITLNRTFDYSIKKIRKVLA